MNGYVIGGYLVVLLALGSYSLFLVARLRATRRRLGATLPGTETRAPDEADSIT
jgi:hypothetical protein